MTLKYTTILGFNKFLKADKQVPDYPNVTSRENIGTGDGSTTTFYLDNKGLISGTENLYTGSTVESSANTQLTRDTHYTVDNDKSQITLTATGLSSVDTNSIFTDYIYNGFNDINSALSSALERAENTVDEFCNTVFVNDSETTPDWSVISNELHEGQGRYLKTYALDNYPIGSISTTSSGAVSSSDTTINVTSTSGFPSAGVFAINTDKVSYTGKTTTSFTGCTGVSNDHADAQIVTSYVVERSLDDEGNSQTWTVLEPNTGYNIEFESGEVKLVNQSIDGTIVLDSFHPPHRVWDRVRVSYLQGYNPVPDDIVRACYMIAAKELYSGEVLNAISRGTNGFNSAGIDDVDEWIEKSLTKYISVFISNNNP